MDEQAGERRPPSPRCVRSTSLLVAGANVVAHEEGR
jgi:hypothetical protein